MEARSTIQTAPIAVARAPSFGALLKRYRRAAGLTQEALAERAGYSVGHISKLESSARQPVPATVELLADALELGPAERRAFARATRHTGWPQPELAYAYARIGPPLIGRSQEEACLEGYLADEAAPPMLLLAGEPGIGKSRLLELASAYGSSQGWFVLDGIGHRFGAQGPYGPLLEALIRAIRHLEPSRLRTALDGCSWLVRLVPELAEIRAVPMPAWSLPADQERRLMFSAVERFLSNIAGPAGTLLVLDNLHWAGADALDLLNTLAVAASRSPLRIIGAYRHNEVRQDDPLSMLMADLAHGRLISQETIGPLASGAAAELLSLLLGDVAHVDEPIRIEVLRKAAGVPFMLVSYAQWLRSNTSRDGQNVTALGIPWDVTQTIQQRVAALPAAAQAVVRITAVSEGDTTRELVAAVAGRLGYSEQDALEAIDTACEAGLLVARGDDTYGLTNDLTREVVERSLGTAQHEYLHREVAAALDAMRTRPRSVAMADHYFQGGEPEKGLIYLKRAGAHANALHAFADAERSYRVLAGRLDGGGMTKEAAYIHERLGMVLGLMGRYDEGIAELERALEDYRRFGCRDGQARAAAQMGRFYAATGDVKRAIARLEHELTESVGASGRNMAVLYLSLAELYEADGQYGQELDSAERAAVLAYASADRHFLALAEMERSTALELLDRPDEGLLVLEDAAVPLTEATGDLWTEAQALDRAAYGHILRGEFREASRVIKRGLLIGLRLDDQMVSATMTLDRGILSYYTGAWRQARADLRWASATLLQMRQSPSTRAAQAAVWLGRLALAQGRWERADTVLRRSFALTNQGRDAQPTLIADCALAERDLVDAKPDAARMRLEPLLATAAFRASDKTEVLALLGWALLELGDASEGEKLVAASLVRASATGLRCAVVDALRIRALGAAYAGRWHEALTDVTEAASLARTLAYPYAEAKALSAAGQLLIRHGAVKHGTVQLGAARTILSQLGEQMYARGIDQLGTTAGGGSPEGKRRTAKSSGKATHGGEG